jgi:hypothetical protein
MQVVVAAQAQQRAGLDGSPLRFPGSPAAALDSAWPSFAAADGGGGGASRQRLSPRRARGGLPSAAPGSPSGAGLSWGLTSSRAAAGGGGGGSIGGGWADLDDASRDGFAAAASPLPVVGGG